MMRLMKSILVIIVMSVLAFPMAGFSADKQNTLVRDARDVIDQIMEIPEQSIPPALLSQAEGIVILPGMLRAGFFIGGRFGDGLLLVRDENRQWSNPVFVNMVGGSFGWQIGASATDVVLVFKTRKGIEDIFAGKYTLGADAAVAAGSVGRQVEGATDIKFRSEIYSYSRSRGLFAGIQLEGASLQVDHANNGLFYSREGVTPQQIAAGDVNIPPSGEILRRSVHKVTETPHSG